MCSFITMCSANTLLVLEGFVLLPTASWSVLPVYQIVAGSCGETAFKKRQFGRQTQQRKPQVTLRYCRLSLYLVSTDTNTKNRFAVGSVCCQMLTESDGGKKTKTPVIWSRKQADRTLTHVRNGSNASTKTQFLKRLVLSYFYFYKPVRLARSVLSIVR